MTNDPRNLTDEFKGMGHDDIVQRLNERGVALEIAIENLERDFNMGTIVRSANAFGIRTVHIIGRKQWNKRGAMMTDKYLSVVYHTDIAEFIAYIHPRTVVAVDNVSQAVDIRSINRLPNAVLVFGSEGAGLSAEMLSAADAVAAIPQKGSTRSLNVGVAAGIAMWEWLR